MPDKQIVLSPDSQGEIDWMSIQLFGNSEQLTRTEEFSRAPITRIVFEQVLNNPISTKEASHLLDLPLFLGAFFVIISSSASISTAVFFLSWLRCVCA